MKHSSTDDIMNQLVVDIDGTLCVIDDGTPYPDREVRTDIVKKLRNYYNLGWSITLYTSRNMNTYNCDTSKIAAHTIPILVKWLEANDVPFDGVHIGKPWPGDAGFYIDDKAIRPSEFLKYSYDEICVLLSQEVV